MQNEQLKPSSINGEFQVLTIKSAAIYSYPKYNSVEFENLVGLEFEELPNLTFKVTSDNFLALAKIISWDFNTWISHKIKLYKEYKTIKDSKVTMLRVAAEL